MVLTRKQAISCCVRTDRPGFRIWTLTPDQQRRALQTFTELRAAAEAATETEPHAHPRRGSGHAANHAEANR